MKTTLKKLGALLFAAVIAVSTYPAQVRAEESVETMQVESINAAKNTVGETSYQGLNNQTGASGMRSNMLTNMSLTATPKSDEITITVTTGSSFVAKKIGARDVIVYEKVLLGWKPIATAGDYTTNGVTYTFVAHCTSATKGKTYRVVCTHYAVDKNGVEYSKENETEQFVYSY